ncbi:MAG: V-type ATP synthase subunit I [Thermoplasmata archaeon]|nr:V-type ATP synthase subunit I [Thermoplasmata archaeon]
MLRPEQMNRAIVVGSIESLDVTIECLYGLGILHLIDFTEQDKDFKLGKPLPKSSDSSQKLLKLRAMMRSLELESHVPSGQMSVDDIEARLDQTLVTLDLNTSGKVESKQKIESLIREKELESSALEPFMDFGLKVEDFDGYTAVSCLVGTCRTDPEGDLTSKISQMEFFKTHRRTFFAVAAFVPTSEKAEASRVLAEHGFQDVKLPKTTGDPKEMVARNARDVVELNEDLRRIEQDLEKIRKQYADLIVTSEEHLAIEVMKAETPLRIASSKHSFVIDGWMPAARVGEIQAALDSLCCGLAFVETLPPEKHDEPPVKLKNPRAVRPFEFFISLVSTPRYVEVDPTLILFVTFPLFFGFMIGDLGFGIGLMALGAFMRLKFKASPDLCKLGVIILAGGLLASVFGLFVFAEAFGVPFHPPESNPDEHSWEALADIPIQPALDKMHDIKEMLAISLVAGWAHLTLGFILGFVNQIGHNRKHAIAKVAWLLILFGLFAEMMVVAGSATMTSEFVNNTILGPFPAASTYIAGIEVSLSAVVLIVVGVVVLPVTEGPLALSEVVGLFTNLVSYTRLAALAVGKGAMALAFNTMLFPLIFESHNIGLILVGALTLFVTQMFFVFFLGALSAGIQAIRLNYVEFFLKFFEGGGKDFTPLEYERKHSVATK